MSVLGFGDQNQLPWMSTERKVDSQRADFLGPIEGLGGVTNNGLYNIAGRKWLGVEPGFPDGAESIEGALDPDRRG